MPDNTRTPYTPPKDLWEARTMGNFDPYRALNPDDPRCVDTHPGREEFDDREFYRQLCLRRKDGILVLETAPREGAASTATGCDYDRNNLLFCGHRGCGKSTELRRFARELNGSEAFLTVYLDIQAELDLGNLNFYDVILLLAVRLFERLEELPEVNKNILSASLEALVGWFKTGFKEKVITSALSGEIITTAGVGARFYGFLKLWAEGKTAFKVDSVEKTAVREEMTKSFSEFTNHFNTFLEGVRAALIKTKTAKDILFLVDGTDKFPIPTIGVDFFVHNAGNFNALEVRSVYSAQVDLIHDGNIKNFFKVITLPMVSVAKEKGERHEEGLDIMFKLITLRLAEDAFEKEGENGDGLIWDFVKYSGGSPRQALHLLNESFISTPDEETRITRAAFEKAKKKLGVEFEQMLNRTDMAMLKKYEVNHKYKNENAEEDTIIHKLLFWLALMQYNAYWRAPNPLICELDVYKNTP